MKRKEYEEKYDDFSQLYLSSPSPKSRRLDPELLADQFQVPASFQEDLQPPAIVNEERALVLYNPANTPLYRSPTVTTDFSVVVNSDFVPGLKDHLLSMEDAMMVRPTASEETIYGPNDNSLAIIPWVAPSAEPMVSSEPEEAEMMDIETDQEAVNWNHHQEQQNQQYLFRPEIFYSNYTPPVSL